MGHSLSKIRHRFIPTLASSDIIFTLPLSSVNVSDSLLSTSTSHLYLDRVAPSAIGWCQQGPVVHVCSLIPYWPPHVQVIFMWGKVKTNRAVARKKF